MIVNLHGYNLNLIQRMTSGQKSQTVNKNTNSIYHSIERNNHSAFLSTVTTKYIINQFILKNV